MSERGQTSSSERSGGISFEIFQRPQVDQFQAREGFQDQPSLSLILRVDDGVKECLVFRGVVYEICGTNEALFCEIKDDDDEDEVALRRDDDDYIGSERARESED